MNVWAYIGSIFGVVIAVSTVATIVVKARYSDSIRMVCVERFLNMDTRIKKVEEDISELRKHTGEFKIFKEVMENRFGNIENELKSITEILKNLSEQTTELRICMKARKQAREEKDGRID